MDKIEELLDKYREEMLETTSRMFSFETEALYNIDTVKSFGVMDSFSLQLKTSRKSKKMYLKVKSRNITGFKPSDKNDKANVSAQLCA